MMADTMEKTPLRTALLPTLMDAAQMEQSVAVVIDVLRASTTIIHALSAGAECIYPCETVEAARQQGAALQATSPPGQVLLGGERHCQTIPGFDLDNSPLSYTRAVVAGKHVVFTTTNGTRALQVCRSAQRVLIGAFVNEAALTESLLQAAQPVYFVCAGTNGQLTAEDILLAGSVIDRLCGSGLFQLVDVQSSMARDFYRARAATPETLRETFFNSLGAESLLRLGMQADIERSLQRSLFTQVPEWNRESGQIR